MAKTRKTLQLKNLAKYDVLIEDTSASSVYFQVTNLPPSFTGGRNSFLLAGSSALKPGTNIQIEILDADGIPIYQNPVQKYVQGNSRLISVEINENTAVGFATIIILGQATVLPNGEPVPPDWQNSYNVRWTRRILVEPNLRNTSPLILENTPVVFAEERRLYGADTASYVTASIPFTASLTPTLYSSFQIGYTIRAEAPTKFSAKLRIVNLDTVSGEIFKFKVYSKVSTNYSDYKLIADIPVSTSELLVTSSIRGDLPIGDFDVSPTTSTNWYSDRLETSSNAVYTISGSTAYYDPTTTVVPFTLAITDDILLRSIRAEIPTFNNQKYAGYISSSGYFIGNKKSVRLFPTTEYTLDFDAYYKKTSASINLTGIEPKVDIYLIGVEGTKVIDNNPLGQKIGTLKLPTGAETYWFQDQQFNFTPQLSIDGNVGIRFVVSNGFWYFSEISLKPASDRLFSPDEAQILVPNTEYYNEYLQHKIEFFDINNNSTDISIVSIPTFFTGYKILLVFLIKSWKC